MKKFQGKVKSLYYNSLLELIKYYSKEIALQFLWHPLKEMTLVNILSVKFELGLLCFVWETNNLALSLSSPIIVNIIFHYKFYQNLCIS